MVTLTCTLRFSDGAAATGTIIAESPQAEYRVAFAGAVDRMPRSFDLCDTADLRGLLKNLARESDAEFQEIWSGEYDHWAL